MRTVLYFASIVAFSIGGCVVEPGGVDAETKGDLQAVATPKVVLENLVWNNATDLGPSWVQGIGAWTLGSTTLRTDSDPSVLLRSDGSLMMAYTAIDQRTVRDTTQAADLRAYPQNNGCPCGWDLRADGLCHSWFTALRLIIRTARSTDGVQWVDFPRVGSGSYAVVGRPGLWDEVIEAAELVAGPNPQTMYLFYTGYRAQGDAVKHIGVAMSSDGGSTWVRLNGGNPVVVPSNGTFDGTAVVSSSILRDGAQYRMVYAGHCYEGLPSGTHCPNGIGGIKLFGAVSSDLVHWQKTGILLDDTWANMPAWSKAGVAEPALTKGADGKFYLLFTAIDSTQTYSTGGSGGCPLAVEPKKHIGVVRSVAPFGPSTPGNPQPWSLRPSPLISASATTPAYRVHGAFAPTYWYDASSQRLNLWFHGYDAGENAVTSVAYVATPLARP